MSRQIEVKNIEVLKPEKKHSRTVRVVRKICALFFWSYFLLKVFIYDFDVILFKQVFPNGLWILEYRFFIILGVVALFWLFVGNKFFWSSLLYVICYPLIVFGWEIPKHIFKNWTIAIFFLPGIMSLLKSIQLRFVSTVFGLIACLLILLNISPYLTIPAMIFLFMYLGMHFFRRFSQAFSPTTFFQNLNNFVAKLWKDYREDTILKHLREASKSKPKTKKWDAERSTAFQMLIMCNRILYYIVHKLKRVQESRIIIVYFMAALTYTFILTVIIFGFQYYGLYNLTPTSFTGEGGTNILFFIYFSFNTFLTITFGNFTPVAPLARIFTTMELLCAILIGIILVFVFTTIIRERYHEELENIILSISSEGKELERILTNEFNMNIAEAEIEFIQHSEGNKKILEYFNPEK